MPAAENGDFVPLDPPTSDPDQLYQLPSLSLFAFHKFAMLLTKALTMCFRAGAEVFKAACDFRTQCTIYWTHSEQEIRRAELEAKRQPQKLLPPQEVKGRSKRA